jgi:hypothetical protein
LPVSDEVVAKTLPRLPTVVHAMVRIQRLTGCRRQVICLSSPGAVDTSGAVWIYTPFRH